MRAMRFSCCAIFCPAASCRFLMTAMRLKRISDDAYLGDGWMFGVGSVG